MFFIRIADQNYYEATRPDREDFIVTYMRKENLCWALSAAIGERVVERETSLVVDIPEDLYDFAIKELHMNNYETVMLGHNEKNIIVKIDWDFSKRKN